MAEAFVARWFPKKHQLVTGMLVSYVGLYGFYRMVKGNPKPLTEAQSQTNSGEKRKQQADAAPQTASLGPTAKAEGGFQGPSMDNMDQWFNNPQNLKDMEAWINKPENVEQWANSLGK